MDHFGKAPFISTQIEHGEYYFLDLAPAPDADLCVVCGGIETCAAGYRIDRRQFPYFGLEFVSAGEGEVVLAGRPFPLRPGLLFVYGPDTEHQITSASDAPLTKHFVDFSGRRAAGLLNRPPFTDAQPLQVSTPQAIRHILDDLQRAGAAKASHAERVCALLLELLLLRIVDRAVPYREWNSQAYARYERCRAYIDANYADLWSISQVGGACGLTDAYLCRLFRRFSHETPYAAITRLKMAKAADLLLHSSMLVKEVAREVGYMDPYHFSRVFKQVYGLSPRNFRQRDHRPLRRPDHYGGA